ncbi:hypothetical thioredoxin [Alphaspiravirus yamagawaense]|uniref:Hypothetical thioredoxin n=1 Tax=Alphaspiravirus yamagawaense TaxID=1157339 RepID=J7QDF3_9VIRU|nr:hypothetical thioredoxin [Aeropyrum coil-shaped virus]CCG27826.1 hypothetical thioredoxin [Aeropyrum coil-shaped virus]
MRKLILGLHSKGGRVSFSDFIEIVKKERAFALISGPNCRECSVLKHLLKESGAERFIKYELEIPVDDEAIEAAQKAGIMHIPIIVDCFRECDMIIDVDPYRQFEELVRRLVGYGLAEVREEKEL